jgi:hypothetical protein
MTEQQQPEPDTGRVPAKRRPWHILPTEPAGPDAAPPPPESREDKLTRQIARWVVEGPLALVTTASLLYLKHGVDNNVIFPVWLTVLLWAIGGIGGVTIAIDRTGKRPPKAERVPIRSFPKPERRAERARRAKQAASQRRVSRWIARKIIACQERSRASLPPDPGVPPGT